MLIKIIRQYNVCNVIIWCTRLHLHFFTKMYKKCKCNGEALPSRIGDGEALHGTFMIKIVLSHINKCFT